MVATRAALLRVVSYNVLSSHLASPSHFSTLDPEHLDAANRLPKLLDKLQQEMDNNNNKIPEEEPRRSTIFCLQEVSYDWCGALHVFFANRGYHVVSGLYGPSYNGYMGVVTAYPTATLETVTVDISRLADTYERDWPEPVPPPSTLSKLWSQASTRFWGLVSSQNQQQSKPLEDPWRLAQRRSNVLLTIVFKDKSSGCCFGVGNYHMPCAFYNPPAMTLHADLCVAHVQRVAAAYSSISRSSVPYIVAGDFNLNPRDPAYQLLTTGTLDVNSPGFPHLPGGIPVWQPTLREPVQSAYKWHTGSEPDFTNYALTQGMEKPFVETLDYIFVSSNDNVQVESVLALPHRTNVKDGPFPNAQELSDHILIAANLCIRNSGNNNIDECERVIE